MIKLTIYEENEIVVNLGPENSIAAKYKQKLLEMIELERYICIYTYTYPYHNQYIYLHLNTHICKCSRKL